MVDVSLIAEVGGDWRVRHSCRKMSLGGLTESSPELLLSEFIEENSDAIRLAALAHIDKLACAVSHPATDTVSPFDEKSNYFTHPELNLLIQYYGLDLLFPKGNKESLLTITEKKTCLDMFLKAKQSNCLKRFVISLRELLRGISWISLKLLTSYGRFGRNQSIEAPPNAVILVDNLVPSGISEEGHPKSHVFGTLIVRGVINPGDINFLDARRKGFDFGPPVTGIQSGLLLEDYVDVGHLLGYFSSLLGQVWRFSNLNLDAVDKLLIVAFASAMFGKAYAQNQYYKSVFSSFLDARKPRCLLFPYEGQIWEKILVREARSRGVRVIGYCHSTVRYWDLRYSRSASRRALDLYPDELVVCGSHWRKALIDFGWEPRHVVTCAPLRYLHLKNIVCRLQPLSTNGLLLLGDYDPKETFKLQRFCEDNANFLLTIFGSNVWFRSHPLDSNNWSAALSQSLGVCVQDDVGPIGSSAEYGVVLASSITSSSLDYWYCGYQIGVLSGCCGLNMSPLRGLSGWKLIKMGSDLRALIREDSSDVSMERLLVWDFSDDAFERWEEILWESRYDNG